jgi:diaminohydroxyphosphoribosylaminopyrimidine deaminase / 5-amino-6-(5-phosphoribosylamino)uracil reductase
MATEAEVAAMRWAVHLAGEALGSTSPNPPVGCVILDTEGRIVGEGITSPPGGPHAEVNALHAAGMRARGGTAVVTLEPCNHHGRTPPCTQALTAAGIARVVFAVTDPHPVAAGGAVALRAAGVEVEGSLLFPEAARGNEAWLTWVEQRRPFVTWVLSASLDGRVAAADGSRGDVNCAESVDDVRGRLRRESDAVLVDADTLRVDDLSLAAVGEVRQQPIGVVVDPDARITPMARIFAGPAHVLVAVAEDADASPLVGRAEVLRLPRGDDGLDPGSLLDALYKRDVCALLLEGGPSLAGQFVAAGLVDRIAAYFAPLLIGGGGLPALLGRGAPSIDRAWRYRLDEVTRLGHDVRAIARRPEAP